MIPHRPPHIHPDGSAIFLTGRIYVGISRLAPSHIKQYLYDKLKEILPTHHIVLDAYVICNNHYHLLIQIQRGNLLPKFVRHLHGATAHYIKGHIPDMVSLGDQVLTREITPWDRRNSALQCAYL